MVRNFLQKIVIKDNINAVSQSNRKGYSIMFFKCPKCEDEYNSIDRLARHWGRFHRLTREELYLSINNLKEPPKCACGYRILNLFGL